MKETHLISFVLFLVLSFTAARYTGWDGPNQINNNIFDDYEYVLETCKLSAFPPRADTMCCGVDVTSSNRIVGGEPTALNQYPWMSIIEYRYINKRIIGPRCGGSLISGLYVLTAAHCVAGKVLEESIPINVVLDDYDKFHNGPDCIISNGKKICTEGETRIPISKIKVHPGYNTTTNYNDIALIKLSKMAPYTDGIRPICLPSGDLSKQYQKNLWLDVAGWGTMKQEKFGDTSIYKSNTSALKRHIHVPFMNTKECQEIWTKVISKQMCAGGVEGKDACMGDSGGPLMFNNRGQYEVSGVVSFGHAKPCGRKGVPTVYTNVHEYKSWIMDQISEMERLDTKKNALGTPISPISHYPKHVPKSYPKYTPRYPKYILNTTPKHIPDRLSTHIPDTNLLKGNILKRLQETTTPSYYQPIRVHNQHTPSINSQTWIQYVNPYNSYKLLKSVYRRQNSENI